MTDFKYKYIITTNGMDECDELIKIISRDEKTTYDDGDYFEVDCSDDLEVKHKVVTSHNNLNFKRKFNQYKIDKN